MPLGTMGAAATASAWPPTTAGRLRGLTCLDRLMDDRRSRQRRHDVRVHRGARIGRHGQVDAPGRDGLPLRCRRGAEQQRRTEQRIRVRDPVEEAANRVGHPLAAASVAALSWRVGPVSVRTSGRISPVGTASADASSVRSAEHRRGLVGCRLGLGVGAGAVPAHRLGLDVVGDHRRQRDGEDRDDHEQDRGCRRGDPRRDRPACWRRPGPHRRRARPRPRAASRTEPVLVEHRAELGQRRWRRGR